MGRLLVRTAIGLLALFLIAAIIEGTASIFGADLDQIDAEAAAENAQETAPGLHECLRVDGPSYAPDELTTVDYEVVDCDSTGAQVQIVSREFGTVDGQTVCAGTIATEFIVWRRPGEFSPGAYVLCLARLPR